MLGKHSGRHALRKALEELGFQVDGQALNTAFKRFKEIADKKKQVTAMDLEAIVSDELRADIAALHAGVVRRRGLVAPPAARDRLGRSRPRARSSRARSPATARSTRSSARSTPRPGIDARLREFRVEAVTGGEDALGEVSVVVEYQGQSAGGQGVATDILEAAGMAYVRAISNGVRKARIAAEQPPVTARPAELATP